VVAVDFLIDLYLANGFGFGRVQNIVIRELRGRRIEFESIYHNFLNRVYEVTPKGLALRRYFIDTLSITKPENFLKHEGEWSAEIFMDLAVSLGRRSGPLPLSPISDFCASIDVWEVEIEIETDTKGKAAFRDGEYKDLYEYVYKDKEDGNEDDGEDGGGEDEDGSEDGDEDEVRGESDGGGEGGDDKDDDG
jgi:hypothetical protein